jgi:hypothetical protein
MRIRKNGKTINLTENDIKTILKEQHIATKNIWNALSGPSKRLWNKLKNDETYQYDSFNEFITAMKDKDTRLEIMNDIDRVVVSPLVTGITLYNEVGKILGLPDILKESVEPDTQQKVAENTAAIYELKKWRVETDRKLQKWMKQNPPN